jgi:hypothetical protein
LNTGQGFVLALSSVRSATLATPLRPRLHAIAMTGRSLVHQPVLLTPSSGAALHSAGVLAHAVEENALDRLCAEQFGKVAFWTVDAVDRAADVLRVLYGRRHAESVVTRAKGVNIYLWHKQQQQQYRCRPFVGLVDTNHQPHLPSKEPQVSRDVRSIESFGAWVGFIIAESLWYPQFW